MPFGYVSRRELDASLAIAKLLAEELGQAQRSLEAFMDERVALKAELAKTYVRDSSGRIRRHPSHVKPVPVDQMTALLAGYVEKLDRVPSVEAVS